MPITIDVLDRQGVAAAIDWAKAEGWNPGLGDLTPFMAVDPAGFLGLHVDGRLAATISAVSYGPAFGFVGFFICRPDLRGRGLGVQLWNAALSRLNATTIGLDGVVAQQANYAKSGFVLAHRNIRFGGNPISAATSTSKRMLRVKPSDVAVLAEFESRFGLFPVARPEFLREWIAAPGVIGFGMNGGYGVIRPCFDGWKIGPLFADDQEDAAIIAGRLIAEAGAAPVFLDVPEPNAAGLALARNLGLAPVFETARMYRGPAPDLDLERTFGITSFELG